MVILVCHTVMSTYNFELHGIGLFFAHDRNHVLVVGFFCLSSCKTGCLAVQYHVAKIQ